MSRSGYSDDNDDQWALIKYRGQVVSATRGKRGQLLLRELRDALDAMPEKRLIRGDLISLPPPFIPPSIASERTPSVCALGCLGRQRNIAIEALDPEDNETLAQTFGVAPQLISEIEYMNDEAFYGDGPEERWQFMRKWVDAQIK